MIHAGADSREALGLERAERLRALPNVEVAAEHIDLARAGKREEELGRAAKLELGEPYAVRGMDVRDERAPVVGKSHTYGLQDSPLLRPDELALQVDRLALSEGPRVEDERVIVEHLEGRVQKDRVPLAGHCRTEETGVESRDHPAEGRSEQRPVGNLRERLHAGPAVQLGKRPEWKLLE